MTKKCAPASARATFHRLFRSSGPGRVTHWLSPCIVKSLLWWATRCLQRNKAQGNDDCRYKALGNDDDGNHDGLWALKQSSEARSYLGLPLSTRYITWSSPDPTKLGAADQALIPQKLGSLKQLKNSWYCLCPGSILPHARVHWVQSTCAHRFLHCLQASWSNSYSDQFVLSKLYAHKKSTAVVIKVQATKVSKSKQSPHCVETQTTGTGHKPSLSCNSTMHYW